MSHHMYVLSSSSKVMEDNLPGAIVFLVRVLLKSRIGVRKSDNIVDLLVRGAIQTGSLATLWAIAGLVTSFFVPRNLIYRVFDITSGSVYTHVGFPLCSNILY